MKPSKLPTLLQARHRLWWMPLIGGAALLLPHWISGAPHTLDLALRTSLAGGLGFLAAVVSTLGEDAWRRRGDKPSTEQLAQSVEAQADQVRMIRDALGELEDRFSEFLARQDVDSVRMENTLLDLNHDVAHLRTRNPSDELRPQLKAIADKFGELAGVRAVVANLSSKMRRVEGLADQVKAVEQRIVEAAHGTENASSGRLMQLGARLGDLRESLHEAITDDVSAADVDHTRTRLESLEMKVNALAEDLVGLRNEVSRVVEPDGLSEALLRAISAQAKIPAATISQELGEKRRAA